MEGIFDEDHLIQTYSQQVCLLNQAASTQSEPQKLVSILFSQKSIIQKFLEKQNYISASLELQLRHETTDSEHSSNQHDDLPVQQFPQNQSHFLQSISSTLLRQQTQILKLEQQTKIIYGALQYRQRGSLNSRSEPETNESDKVETKTPSKDSKIRSSEKPTIKWFVKAVSQFMEKNVALTTRMLEQFDIERVELLGFLKIIKKIVQSVDQLESFLDKNRKDLGKIFRICSNLFLRKHYLGERFRIKNNSANLQLKYRNQLMRVFKNYN